MLIAERFQTLSLLLQKLKKITRYWCFVFTLKLHYFYIEIINKSYKNNNQLVYKLSHCLNCKQVNKNVPINTTRMESYTNNNNETTMFIFIEISRRWGHEHSPSRTFIKLFTLLYKIQGKASNAVSKSSISLVWRRYVFKVNNSSLKISVTKICRTIFIVYAKDCKVE